MPAKRDIPKTTSQFLIGVAEKTRAINEEVEKIRIGRGSFIVLAGAIEEANTYLEKTSRLLPKFRISSGQLRSFEDLKDEIRELTFVTEKKSMLEMASNIKDASDAFMLGVGSADRMALSTLRIQEHIGVLLDKTTKYRGELVAIQERFADVAEKSDEMSVEQFLNEIRDVNDMLADVHNKMRDSGEATMIIEKSFSEIGGRMSMVQKTGENLQSGYSGMVEKVQQITNSFAELRRHGRGYTSEIDSLIKRTEDLGKNIETMRPREALREFNLINREARGLQRNIQRSGKETVGVRREFLGIFNQIRGIKQETTFQGVERLAGMGNVKSFIQQISNVPGLQGLGALAGIIPGGISVAAISMIISTFVTEWDKMIDSARKMRESLAVVGAEGWRAGVMEMTRLRIGLEAQMRALTNSAAGAEEAMNILSQLKDVGGFTELTFKGERVADMMDRLGEGMERGDTGAVVADLSRRLAYLSAGLNNLSTATGVSEGEILKQAMTLSRFTDSNERDIETLTETWFALSYTANKANVSMSDYVGWVEQGVKQLRFFGFTVSDVNAIAYKYHDELRQGIVSMEDLNNMVTQTVSHKMLPHLVLLSDAVMDNVNKLEEQTPGIGEFLREMQKGTKMFPQVFAGIMQGARGLRGAAEQAGIPYEEFVPEKYRERPELLDRFGKAILDFAKIDFREMFQRQLGAGQDVGMRLLLQQAVAPMFPEFGGIAAPTLAEAGARTRMYQESTIRGAEKGLELQREAQGQFNEMTGEFKQFRGIQSTIAEGISYLKSAIVGTETMGVRIMEIHPDARKMVNESLTEETGQ